MQLIVFRPEYQLSVDLAQNRIFYQNFGQMQGAMALPYYLADWAAALASVRPGFSILSDLQVVNQANPALLEEFQASERLLLAHGIGVMAEVHMPGLATRYYANRAAHSRTLPVRYFLSIWEAAQFLDDLQAAG